MDTLQQRFEVKWCPEPNTGCWLWTAYRNRSGYGQIQRGARGEGAELAHRASWRLHRGSIPDGLDVLHKCDTPACVNPDHLFLGTQADNTADMRAKGRANPFGGHWARGEQHALARLTSQDVIAIRLSRASTRALARHFGVDRGTIKSVRERRTWRHV